MKSHTNIRNPALAYKSIERKNSLNRRIKKTTLKTMVNYKNNPKTK